MQTKDVVSSHFIPASLYDYCRPPNRNPVAFNTELVIETSRQMQHPLLCRECEEILNSEGESWMIPLFANFDGSFPFHDILTKCAPVVTDGEAKLYAAKRNPEIKVEKIAHFAIGIFWKAAVHSWSGSRKEPLINLGPYREPFRKYLRKENNFPTDTALMISVLPSPVQHISFHAPYQGLNKRWHNFILYILGIEFQLLVGRGIPKEMRVASFFGHPDRPILLFDFQKSVQDIAVAVMKKAHKANNVRKYLKNL
ncbi:MAG TPA: hypothetical protein VJR23_02360 [Candidatus Acidoferrales bacterium]|nr:hypothetical protein [Candidatus Acidoferrales bacterium]